MKSFPPSESLPVGLLLALTGGILDAYSYLNRGQVFATAETGNIVLLGICLARGQWTHVFHYLLPILAFTAGVLAAEGIHRRTTAKPKPVHWRQSLLLVECLAILLVSLLPAGHMNPLANILISFTSALQVQSFRSFHGCSCATTMCTGNLRSGTDHLFHWLLQRDSETFTKAGVYYGLILCFISGAILSGLLTPLFSTHTVLVACLPLLTAILLIVRCDRIPL